MNDNHSYLGSTLMQASNIISIWKMLQIIESYECDEEIRL